MHNQPQWRLTAGTKAIPPATTSLFPAMSPDIEPDTELADHLFSNGKFLLHTFPLQPKRLTSCTLSRTYSVDSKDSLVSSRSNSTNSRSSSSSSCSSVDSKDSLVSSRSNSTNSRSSSSSSCSSARTSTSEASTGVATKAAILPEKGGRSPVHYSNNYYLPAEKWQFMATVPVLNRRTSQKRKGEDGKQKGSPENKKCSRKKGYCRRLFRWLVSTCKECHAIEPSKKVF